MLIKAPLKVNLSLKIVDKLENGYHELRSYFHSVRIFEEIQIDITDKKGINISCNLPQIPVDKKNTVYMAVKLMIEHWPDFSGGLNIKIQKIVFPGTGLGAGSADAGAILYALGKKSALDEGLILNIAKKIGADVPFCYMAAKEWSESRLRIQAKVESIGEKIDLVTPLNGHFVILIPNDFSISTPDAFSKFDMISDYKNISKDYPELGCNDFEKVLDKEQVRKVSTAKELLYSYGAQIAVLTGSGSSIVGYFNEKPDIINNDISNYLLLTEED